MKKKICFIINPISGVGKQKIVEQLVNEQLSAHDFEIEIAYTKAPHHATELSKDAANRNFDIVVAVGGDGSVHEVSKGLINSTAALAILPCGSGNGLARHLGIHLNLKNALKLIQQSKSMKMDTLKISNNSFVNVAGIGFDAHIAHLFANYGKRGFLSYIKLVMKEYFQFKEQNFSLIIDEREIKLRAFMLSVANGSQFGNNAFISPIAQVNDGIMEVCILKKIPLYAAPYFAFQLFTKRAHHDRTFSIG